jgi:hypothetical protein
VYDLYVVARGNTGKMWEGIGVKKIMVVLLSNEGERGEVLDY